MSVCYFCNALKLKVFKSLKNQKGAIHHHDTTFEFSKYFETHSRFLSQTITDQKGDFLPWNTLNTFLFLFHKLILNHNISIV